jgi:hypothetical protein
MENENEKTKTDFEKLKEANEEFEKELIKAREMRAERQKLEAELMLGSTAGQPKVEEPKVETAKEYAEKVILGKIKPTVNL